MVAIGNYFSPPPPLGERLLIRVNANNVTTTKKTARNAPGRDHDDGVLEDLAGARAAEGIQRAETAGARGQVRAR